MEGWRAGAEWWRVWLLGTGQKGELHPQLWRDQDFGTRTPHWRRTAGAGPGGQGWGAGPVRGPQGADGACFQWQPQKRSAHRLTRWGDTLGGGLRSRAESESVRATHHRVRVYWGKAKRPC